MTIIGDGERDRAVSQSPASLSQNIIIPRAAYERVWPSVAAAALRLSPVIFEPDGTLSVDGIVVSPTESAAQIAWFSPDLFALGQDDAFLEMLAGLPHLKWMQSGRSGYDHPGFRVLIEQGVRVTLSKAPAPSIGEYVIGSVLNVFQRVEERRLAQVARRWLPLPFKEVNGSRWLLVGYGDIGREIAIRARALGAHLTGVRRSGGDDPNVDKVITPEEMMPHLGQADVVVLAVPLTSDNDGAYGAEFFAAMGANTLFVNVGRGQLVDEEALRVALDAKGPFHAVLDVTRVEPLPVDAWQWDHPRVTLTAHLSALGSGLIARTDAILIENLRRYQKGEALRDELSPADFR